MMQPNAKTLLARLDRAALAQLCEEVLRLHDENERLAAENKQLRALWQQAEQWADDWREQAFELQMSICESTGTAPGITRSGQLVIITDSEMPPSHVVL